MNLDAQKLKTNLKSVKKYVIDHGPEIVTALAAITAVAWLRKQYYLDESTYFDEKRDRLRDMEVIGWLRREGHNFDYYPGLGVWSDFDGYESEDQNAQCNSHHLRVI